MTKDSTEFGAVSQVFSGFRIQNVDNNWEWEGDGRNEGGRESVRRWGWWGESKSRIGLCRGQKTKKWCPNGDWSVDLLTVTSLRMM
jgi:hypothetical protein